MLGRHVAWRPVLLGCGIGAVAVSQLAAQQTRSPEARLAAMGIELPSAQPPVATYVPTVRTGNLVFVVVNPLYLIVTPH